MTAPNFQIRTILQARSVNVRNFGGLGIIDIVLGEVQSYIAIVASSLAHGHPNIIRVL